MKSRTGIEAAGEKKREEIENRKVCDQSHEKEKKNGG